MVCSNREMDPRDTFHPKADVTLAASELAAKDAEIAALREALAKSDPWKTEDLFSDKFPKYYCVHCGAEYNQMANEPKETHKPDCIWLAAVLQEQTK